MIESLKKRFSQNPKFYIGIIAYILTAIIIIPALIIGKFKLIVAAIVALAGALFLIADPLHALLLYIVLIPIEEVIVINALGTLTKIAAMVFVASYLFHRRFRVDLRSFTRLAWLFIFWVSASLLWSIQTNLVGYNQLLQLFIMAFLIADYVATSPKVVRYIMGYYTASSFFVALIGISNFMRGLDASGFSQSTRTSAIEGQSVAHFAYYMLPAFLYSFQNIFDTDNSKARRFIASIASIVFLIAILMSGTRGSWLAIIGVMLMVYIPRWKLKQQLSFLGILLITGIAVMQIPAVVQFVEFRTSNALSSGGAGRTTIWKMGYQTFLSHPIIGAGIRNTEDAMTFTSFSKTPFNLELHEPFRPRVTHNIYIQIAIELGVIGLIIFLLWLGQLLTSSIYSKEWLIVLAYLIGMLIGGLTNPQLNRKYFWLVLGLAEGLRYYSLKAELALKTKNETDTNKKMEGLAYE